MSPLSKSKTGMKAACLLSPRGVLCTFKWLHPRLVLPLLRLFMMKEVGEFVRCPHHPEHLLSNYQEAGYRCLSQCDSCEQTFGPGILIHQNASDTPPTVTSGSSDHQGETAGLHLSLSSKSCWCETMRKNSKENLQQTKNNKL